MQKLVIGRDAYNKIRYYVDRTKFEISGLGVIENIKGIPTVTDIILLKQTNEHAETELDAVALNKADYDFMMSGKEGSLNFWWHSHNIMEVYWSQTDEDAIEQLTGTGEFFHGVFNHKGEYRIRYTNKKEFDIDIDDIPMEIDEDLVCERKQELLLELQMVDLEIEEELEAQYKELVTEVTKVYGANYKGNFGFPKKQIGGDVLPMGNKQAVGHNHNTVSGDYWDDWKTIGKSELQEMGYTPNQILHLQESCDVWDGEDINWFERQNSVTIAEYFQYANIY